MLHGSALPDPAPGDSARWGGRTSGLGRFLRRELHGHLQLEPVLPGGRRVLGDRDLHRLGGVQPGPPCRRAVRAGRRLLPGRVRRTLESDQFVREFDCHGRILGGGYDSGPQPLGEQLLVLLRARAAGHHESRIASLISAIGRAVPATSVVGIMSHRISGRTHTAVGLRP
jgi:hypothetical protein